MKKDEHLKNQVLYITNPAYDALQSENLLEDHDDEIDREQLSLLNREL
ncbi:hypothetical protein [Fredinandcohnia onubensis]|nr:hypothetical protein [Fredinandcohnia onubensis]